ncbi:hypothetical protein NP570_25565, partial [Vibrio parahaemolyticus]|nr:hypothetical protein [Vibrio parahaemolyticus]
KRRILKRPLPKNSTNLYLKTQKQTTNHLKSINTQKPQQNSPIKTTTKTKHRKDQPDGKKERERKWRGVWCREEVGA